MRIVGCEKRVMEVELADGDAVRPAAHSRRNTLFGVDAEDGGAR